MTTTLPFSRYIYWLDSEALNTITPELAASGYTVSSANMTPCETLNASGKKVIFAKPQVWSRLCSRQGSWYRESDKKGKTLLVSDHPLPGAMQLYLDAEMTQSNFKPDYFPTKATMREMINSPEYQNLRPDEWENAGVKDSIMFKIFFSVTRFWGAGDNMSKHWLSHRANHANFLTNTFTTNIDGEDVPYTVTDNKGVCSSCVEFFNVSAKNSRKLVNACPGSITFSKVKRDTYYDIKPINIPIMTI